MRVKYEDGPAAVTLAGENIRVERGVPAEVSNEAGEQLLKQGWVKVSSSDKSPTPKPVKKETK